MTAGGYHEQTFNEIMGLSMSANGCFVERDGYGMRGGRYAPYITIDCMSRNSFSASRREEHLSPRTSAPESYSKRDTYI